MPTNLVASINRVLTPELLSRVASGLGLDPAVVQKAVAAGVPALLAALTSLIARPGGAAKLGDVVARQQPGVLSSIVDSMGGSGQKALTDTGLGTLSSLLGGSTLSALTDAVGKYANLGEAGSKGLMGILGPLLMGVLGQEQRASGSDGSGIAQMLLSQKDNIARAMPSGFAKYLAGTGILDTITTSTGKERARLEPARPSGQWAWFLPALGILALGALAWYMLGRERPQSVAVLPPTNVEAPALTPGAAVFIVTADEANKWIGRPVYSSDNRKVGEIIELQRGPDDKVTDVYMDTGTFLGIGASRYRATSDQVREVKPDSLVLTLKESEILAAPRAGEQPQ